jgi:hypothetical protein
MHIQVGNLLLCVQSHILILFYGYLLVDLEYGLVAEAQAYVLEREDGFHGHEQGDARLHREARVLLRQWVLNKEFVELPDLFTAE